jgi:tetratricopeptide (TPR) repeat protein
LLAQNMLDLGLEIPAIAAALASVLGALCGAASAGPEAPRQTDRLLWSGSLLALGCLTLSLLWGGESPGRERERLRAQLAAATGAPPREFWSALRGAVEAYPADPYFPLLGSTAALASRQNALPWVARALERGPASGTVQIHLARALRARGATDQALAALQRAARLDPSQVDMAIRLALAWDPGAVNEVVPEGPTGAAVLQRLADEASDPLQRVRWLEQALERDPSDADAHYRLAFALSRDLAKPDGPVCQGRRDWCSTSALEHVDKADRPDSSRAAILKTQLLSLKTGAPVAEEALAAVCSRLPRDAECARELVALALKNGSPRLAGAINALVALGCSTSERCAQTHMSLGDQFASLGQWQSAANHYREATREMPSPGSWRALAEASRQLGQPARAEDALRRAALLDVPTNVAP